MRYAFRICLFCLIWLVTSLPALACNGSGYDCAREISYRQAECAKIYGEISKEQENAAVALNRISGDYVALCRFGRTKGIPQFEREIALVDRRSDVCDPDDPIVKATQKASREMLAKYRGYVEADCQRAAGEEKPRKREKEGKSTCKGSAVPRRCRWLPELILG